MNLLVEADDLVSSVECMLMMNSDNGVDFEQQRDLFVGILRYTSRPAYST